MQSTDIANFVGTLGLGGVIGVYTKSWLDYRLKNNQILLEARVKAYSKTISMFFNKAMEPEVFSVPEPLKFVTVNKFFSEVTLLAGAELLECVQSYIPKVCEYHKELNSLDEAKAKKLHMELEAIVDKMFYLMRRELTI